MKQFYYLIYLLSSLFFLSGCVEDSDMDTRLQNAGVPELGTFTNENVSKTATTIKATASVNKENGSPLTERGFKYWRSDNVNEADTVRENIGLGKGEYTLTIEQLTNGVEYKVTPFAKNEAGIGYGDTITVYTNEGTGAVKIAEIDNNTIHATSVFVQGVVTKEGEGDITEYGFYVWVEGAENDTIIYDNKEYDVVKEGNTYSYTINNLNPSTNYIVQAFARNNFGKFDTDAVEKFSTLDGRPRMGTLAVKGEPGFDNVTLRAQLVTEGDTAVNEVGFCWGTIKGDGSPNIIDNDTIHSILGEDGYFEGTINGLESNVKYYVIAFATNKFGSDFSKDTLEVVTRDVYPSIFIDEATAFVMENGLVTFSGELSNEGETPVTELGICYSSKTNTPDATNCEGKEILKPEDLDENGRFSVHTTHKLKGSKTYYVRAFATNKAGTRYSNISQEFKTPSIFTSVGENYPGTDLVLYYAGFTIENTAYVLGGDKGATRSNELWGYNADQGVWRDFTPYGTQAMGISVCTDGNNAYAFGGKGVGKVSNLCYAYNTYNNEWISLKEMDGENVRFDAVSFVYNDYAYVIGGKNLNSTLTDTIFYYDISANTWHDLSKFPVAFSNGVALTNGDNVYVGLGNKDESERGLWVASGGDFSNESWTPLAALPDAMSNVSTGVIYNNSIYVVDDFGVIWQYNIDGDQWYKRSKCSDRARYFKIYVLNDTIHILGLDRYTNIFMTYDPSWDN